MITQVEITGFKTFRDFKVQLAPLQIIVGANGAGKSNFFDALLLLSRLADDDLRTTFQQMRGEAGELFTLQPGGGSRDEMQFAVEMLVENRITDSWGAEAQLKYTRLRYELAIVRKADQRGLDRLYVQHESLKPITRGEDGWIKQMGLKAREDLLPRLTGGRSAPFISTSVEQAVATVYLHQDGNQGRKSNVASQMERTVLSGVANTEFPHAFAARQEMRSWRFLQLNPEVLRNPCSMVAPQIMGPDGRNLPGVLARLQAEDPLILKDISRDLANLVPGVVKIEVEANKTRDEYVIWARTADGRRFSSRVLSDGTLRMLALAALKNDPDHRGVVLFEEPENGVHPQRLRKIGDLISQLGSDFQTLEEGEPLRQFLCNTHSPLFISQPSILPHVLFAYAVEVADPRQPEPMRSTRMVPVLVSTLQHHLPLGIAKEEASYSLAEVRTFLENADIGESLTLLNAHVTGQNGRAR
jgi:predicted ATPase